MAHIIRISFIEHKIDRNNKPYTRTHALLNDGSEVVGYGNNFKLGDKVESFFHREVHKMRLTKH